MVGTPVASASLATWTRCRQISDGFVIATPAAFHMAELVGHAT